MIVKLLPHMGMVRVPGGPSREVDVGQDVIWLDGVHVGYVARHKTAGIVLLGDLSDAAVHAIREAVNTHLGHVVQDRKVVTPPAIGDDEPQSEESEDNGEYDEYENRIEW